MHGAVKNRFQCRFGCLVESDACGSVCRGLWCVCGRKNVGVVICQSNEGCEIKSCCQKRCTTALSDTSSHTVTHIPIALHLYNTARKTKSV